MLAHRNGLIFAQLVFPFAAIPASPITLAQGWLVVLELLRHAVLLYSFYDGDLVKAAGDQAAEDFRRARRGDRAAIVRLRVMWAIVARPAVRRAPLP